MRFADSLPSELLMQTAFGRYVWNPDFGSIEYFQKGMRNPSETEALGSRNNNYPGAMKRACFMEVGRQDLKREGEGR